mmetsp:Transcript_42108/g.85836  ORF Transcript_42108/g.85836 Transcript_42108/m.85836 type:complete len:496 (-) Transcript_42108:304-1791(-)
MSKETFKSRSPWWQVVDVLRIYWALLLGNILEWYEYAIFSFLEPYFQSHFFHGSAVSTWLGFSVTFVARPFGGLVLGVVGDIFGRKVSTFLSIFGMMVGTVGQGLLPTYKHGDVAGTIGLVLLVLLRLLQGICTGGEIASVTTYITEVGAKESLCRSMMLVGITCNIGFLLAQSASYGLELLGKENMEDWGWRIPFVIAIIPGTIATLGRRCMPESDEFLEGRARGQAAAQTDESEASESQISDTAKGGTGEACRKMKHLISGLWAKLLVGIGAVVAASVLQYGGLIWCSVLLQKKGTDPPILLAAGITARILSILLVPAVSWLADTQGIAWILFLGSSLLALLGAPLYMVMTTYFNSFEAVVASYGLGYGFIFTFVGMIFFVYVCELFPVEIRNAGVGLSYNIGFCCFGGFAPMIFEAAIEHNTWAPGCLLSLAGLATTASVTVSLLLQRRGKMQLTHIRPEPYFSPCGVPKKVPKKIASSELGIERIIPEVQM